VLEARPNMLPGGGRQDKGWRDTVKRLNNYPAVEGISGARHNYLVKITPK
jgi:hypothetical protein